MRKCTHTHAQIFAASRRPACPLLFSAPHTESPGDLPTSKRNLLHNNKTCPINTLPRTLLSRTLSTHDFVRTAIANRAPQILGHLVQILEQLVEAHLREVIRVRIAAQGSQGSVNRLEIGIVVADVMNLPVRVCVYMCVLRES